MEYSVSEINSESEQVRRPYLWNERNMTVYNSSEEHLCFAYASY